MVDRRLLYCNGGESSPCCCSVDYRYLAAEIELGPRRVGDRTDGGLQILLPRSDTDIDTLSSFYNEGDAEAIFVEWDRSYYEIGLEVSPQSRIQYIPFKFFGAEHHTEFCLREIGVQLNPGLNKPTNQSAYPRETCRLSRASGCYQLQASLRLSDYLSES